MDSGEWNAAALAAGYQKKEANAIGKAASRSPAILAAVHAEIGRRLVEGAAVGYQVLIAIARAPAESAQGDKLRLEAAKELLKLGGHVGPRAKSQENSAGKQLHEMSIEDLRRQKDALESAIADRSKPISAQKEARDDSQVSDLLGD